RTGEEAELSFEKFPTVGLSKTYCLNAQIANSACTATACGVKANRGTIGVSGVVTRYDCDASTDRSTNLDSIAAWALADGRDAGIVTTTRVTHATPANRHYESDVDYIMYGHDTVRCPDIAHQLVHTESGNKFKVILGGGRREFILVTLIDEEGDAGRRTDDRNLIEEWQTSERNASPAYIWNRDQLVESSASPPEYLGSLGLFESDHMQYHLEADNVTESTLAELTEVATFFLFVEGGRIDRAAELLSAAAAAAAATAVPRARARRPAPCYHATWITIQID
ncbi:LOW QUALITY PROTEIN: membrane-bound alkaline phosphatase-like, partial [Aphomia sociella]